MEVICEHCSFKILGSREMCDICKHGICVKCRGSCRKKKDRDASPERKLRNAQYFIGNAYTSATGPRSTWNLNLDMETAEKRWLYGRTFIVDNEKWTVKKAPYPAKFKIDLGQRVLYVTNQVKWPTKFRGNVTKLQPILEAATKMINSIEPPENELEMYKAQGTLKEITAAVVHYQTCKSATDHLVDEKQ